jgi:hypothetical protein
MKKPKLGASGKFPQGKLNESDEGELTFAVASDPESGLIHIHFGKPVAWLAMPGEIAIELARRLLKHAGAKRIEIEL